MTAHQIDSSSNGVESGTSHSAIQQWLSQGETLYEAAMADFRAIENQLVDLEAKLTEKRAEVNQIAHLIGKPPAETSRRLSAQLIEDRDRPHHRQWRPPTLRMALAGRKFGR